MSMPPCTTRNIAVGNTVVTDTTVSPYDVVNVLGGATIEGITFKLLNGLQFAVYSENGSVPNGSQLTVRRNVFVQTYGGTPSRVYWSAAQSVGGVVRIVDNLLHDNSGGGTLLGAIDVFALCRHPRPSN
jgi:hypothetical protein